MIKYADAINLRHGQIFHHRLKTNADGTPVRCRVNGRTKTWKGYPQSVRDALNMFRKASKNSGYEPELRETFRKKADEIEALKGKYFQIPVKYGMYECFYIRNYGYSKNDEDWNLPE